MKSRFINCWNFARQFSRRTFVFYCMWSQSWWSLLQTQNMPQHETMVFQRKSVGDWLFSKAGKKLLTNCHSSVAQCQIKSNINSACANDEQRGIAWNNTPFKFSTIIYLLLAKVSYEPPSTIVKILAPLPPSRIKGIIICLNSHWPHNIP